MNRRALVIILLSWLAMVAWDFLLHGGLLACFYVADDAFLLPPLEAFQRIPLGYAAFLIIAVFIYWLLPRLELQDGRAAFVFGLKLGAFMWGAQMLALYSISTIQLDTALAWFLGQTFEMGVGAWVIFQGLQAESLKRLTWRVLAFLILSFILTIILQNVGLAPQIVNP